MSLIQLRKLPANQCWVFVWGDQIISMGRKFLFSVRQDAVEAAREAGIAVDKQGNTSSIQEVVK